MAAIMQHKGSNYEGDVMSSLIELGERLSGKEYGASSTNPCDKSLRILADHSRAVTFMIADGILPSNEGRGYVLRRLLRRAVYHGRLLGIQGAFLTEYAHEVERIMGEHYNELVQNKALVDGIISAEEERFGATLNAGESMLQAELDKLGEGDVLSGEVAFKLHDTYGFPIDLTREISESAGHEVDMDAFDRAMDAQKERARATANRDAWGKANNVWAALSDRLDETVFDGYDHDDLDGCTVVALVRDGEEVASAKKGEKVEVVLDRTSFYGEMGGQIGDTGRIFADGLELRIEDTLHREGGFTSHECEVVEGEVSVGVTVSTSVDHGRRELIRRNHTATHLLDAALKEVLGEHVNQAGSLVAPDRLRFDFTHFEAVTTDELARIEGEVNAQIFAAKPVVTNIMGIDEAKAAGAVALFGEKYGDVVRVVSVGTEDKPFSRELCGGTHARNTAELGFFKIVSESSVGSNARRIEAVTSAGALEFVDERLAEMDEVAAALKCRPADVMARVEQLKDEKSEAEKKLKAALVGGSSNQVADAVSSAVDMGAYKLVVAHLNGISGKELRNVWDTVRDKIGSDCACVLASEADGKVGLLAAATDGAVSAGFSAGNVVKEISGLVGGKGGGRPNMAQAGGKDATGIDAALDAAKKLLGA